MDDFFLSRTHEQGDRCGQGVGADREGEGYCHGDARGGEYKGNAAQGEQGSEDAAEQSGLYATQGCIGGDDHGPIHGAGRSIAASATA